jgi:branched-chain amino acid transport system ATP-binding protein
MGHTTLHAGRILLDGADIARAQIQDRVRAGIGYVPQEREVFPSLTVEENLDVAARPGGDWSRDRVYDLFSNLAARRANRGNQLSGGEQQMLAIGRALMGNPRVLLMDEPSEGLAPVIVEELQKAMARLRADGGMTMILVEQNIRVALGFGERTIVMNRGTIIHDGPSATLEADPDRVVELMGLGEGAAG